jgi:formate dehydrogenase major subunit
MTNHWQDIKNADVIVISGGNAAEAHPCGFKWVTEAKHYNNAKLLVIDPRFTRSAAMSDMYCQIRPGSDIAFWGGLINYMLSNDAIQKDYVSRHTNASFLVNEGFGFEDGVFTGHQPNNRDYDRATWSYQLEEPNADGVRFAKVDPTLQDPRCVYQLMKAFYARYTPEMVERISGMPKDKAIEAWKLIATTAAPDKSMTIMYALGWTQHSKGSQMIRAAAIAQLLLGNIGMPGGGMNALRGHSNIQGLTDLGLMSNLIPGYLTLPGDGDVDLKNYLSKRQFKPMRPGQISFWQNYPKFMVSFQKAMYGDAATPENDFAYDWLPKLDMQYDVLRAFEFMHQGRMNGYICQGFNPLMSAPNKRKVRDALAKLKFLVVMDPLATETSEFWANHGEINDSDPSKIQTEVFRFPTTCFAEENGSLTNSGRWLQWHWKGAEPPGEALPDIDIMTKLYLKMKEMYAKEGGALPDPILKLRWPYLMAKEPKPEEIAREINGSYLVDIVDPKDPTRVLARGGTQVPTFAALQADGSTAAGCWIYTGCWTEAGNNMARRDNSDPYGVGIALNWAFAWPANRRILYNRASCDGDGKPYKPQQAIVAWNGRAWGGADIPDFPPGSNPSANAGAYIMCEEGVARLWCRALMRDGPFPEHYEPFESPVANALHPKVGPNPAARVFRQDLAVFGKPEDFPFVATTYRLTEHFHFWSKHNRSNAVMQPELFVEIGEELAKLRGVVNGDTVEVRSNRGRILAKVVVTKRIKAMKIDGKETHIVGIPIHWGFTGETKKGFGANTLTPYVGDANIETPEYKAFLVDLKKAARPSA